MSEGIYSRTYTAGDAAKTNYFFKKTIHRDEQGTLYNSTIFEDRYHIPMQEILATNNYSFNVSGSAVELTKKGNKFTIEGTQRSSNEIASKLGLTPTLQHVVKEKIQEKKEALESKIRNPWFKPIPLKNASLLRFFL